MSTAAREVFDRTPYSAPEADLVESGRVTEDRLFSVDGRIGVMRYNRRVCESMFALVAAGLALYAATTTEVTAVIAIVGIPAMIVILGAVALMIYSAIKRLHDLGRSGWYYLLGMIPLVGAIYVLYYSFAPGKDDGNAFGGRREATTTDKVLGVIGIFLVAAMNIGALLSIGST